MGVKERHRSCLAKPCTGKSFHQRVCGFIFEDYQSREDIVNKYAYDYKSMEEYDNSIDNYGNYSTEGNYKENDLGRNLPTFSYTEEITTTLRPPGIYSDEECLRTLLSEEEGM